MQKLVFKNGSGNEIDLTSGNFGIVNWEGLSNTSLNIQTQQVPFEDGGVFLDALMEQREIAVTVAIYDGNNLELRYQKKRELISALNPKLGEGVLIYTNDYLSRQIHAVPQIPIFENKNSNDAGTLKASVAFSCPNPYWEDLEETEIILKPNLPVSISNNGDVPAQMEIEIYTNNAQYPAIERMSDNQKIMYNGILSKSLYINTSVGNKQAYTEDIDFETINLSANIKDLCYSSKLGLFIGVASGILYYSYGGIDWKTNVSTEFNGLNGICYSEERSLFVAVGNSGEIITSPDGKNWTSQTSGVTTNLNKINYSDSKNLFVIVGNSGTILTSSDGVSWEVQTSSVSADLYDVIYSEEKTLFVAVGNTGTIITSENGTSWTSKTSGTNRPIMAITYSDKLDVFVSVSTYGNYITSSDGVSWSLNGIGEMVSFSDIIYSDFLEAFIASASNGFYISTNLTTWRYKAFGFSNDAVYLCSVNELKTVVFAGKLIYITQDGNNITTVKGGIATRINKIIYSEKRKLFIGVCDGGKIISSADNINWEVCFSGRNVRLSSVIYSEKQDLFVAVGHSNYILTSSDGISWEERSYSSGGPHWGDIAYSEKINTFVIVGSQGEISTSSDGIIWNPQISPTNTSIKFVYYFEKSEQFVAIGNGVWYSPDGISWTDRLDNTLPNTTNSITYAKSLGLYLAIGEKVLTSPDGNDWQIVVPALPYTMNDVSYSNELNMFVAINTSGVILISQDIENWELFELGITIELANVLYSDLYNTFIITGNNGAIFNSFFSAIENQIQNISSDSDMNLSLMIGNNTFRLTRQSGIVNAKISYRQKYIGV